MYAETRLKLNRLGAPFDILSFNDVPDTNLSKYKLMIFSGLFVVTPEKHEILRQYVFNSERTILFLYAPGICNGERLNISYAEDLTGIEFKTKGVAEHQHDHWRAVYSSDYDNITPGVLRALSQQSGVTIYCESEVPVFANNKLVAIHMAEGGDKLIHFPHDCESVTELYTGMQIPVSDGCFPITSNRLIRHYSA